MFSTLSRGTAVLCALLLVAAPAAAQVTFATSGPVQPRLTAPSVDGLPSSVRFDGATREDLIERLAQARDMLRVQQAYVEHLEARLAAIEGVCTSEPLSSNPGSVMGNITVCVRRP